MKEIYVFISGMVFIVISLAIGMYYIIDYHENVHQTIYEDYGISSKVSWHFGTTIKAITTTTSDYKPCNETCESMQEMNEIVGYHLSAIVINMWLVVIVVYFLWWMHHLTPRE